MFTFVNVPTELEHIEQSKDVQVLLVQCIVYKARKSYV